MNLKLDKYLPFIEDIDAPLSDKEAMLRTVWGIMESQVDQAFGLHPVQCCNRKKKLLPKTQPKGLDSIETKTVSTFNNVSSNDDSYKRKA